MNSIENKGSQELSRIFTNRIAAAMVVYSLLIGMSVVVAFVLYHMNSYQGSSYIYAAAQLFKRHMLCFFAVVWLAGLAIIIWFYWQKTLHYLDLVADASKKLVSNETDKIELPREMDGIAQQMNEAREHSQRSDAAVRESEQKKSDLIVYLAHDLKTPLTSVIGYLMLLCEKKNMSDEQRTTYLAIALERAERLEQLIDEFFEIAKFNLGDIKLEKRPVNLQLMLEQIAYEFRPQLEQKHLMCSVDAGQGEAVMIEIDTNKMERVFDNLIRNAINYSFESTEIHIEITAAEGETAIAIKNSGQTIPEEKLQRIFEKFYRLDESRSGKNGGAGLGLAIAKQIVELHGGQIRAQSSNNNIAFTVILPAR